MRLSPLCIAAGLVFMLQACTTPPIPTASQLPTSAPSFLYEGRFDTSDPAGPVVIWQGSRISFDFEGNSLELQFADVSGQNFFDAAIDGRRSLVELRENHAAKGTSFTGLGSGRHRLVLFKRSEAAAGTVRFRGATLSNGAHAFAPERSRDKLRVQ